MPRNTTNIVSPRRIVAGVFVFIGLFAMCFGFGNRSQALIVTGAAVMVLSFSVRLFSNWRRTPRQWVLGTGHVTDVSDPPPPDVRFGRCTVQLVVEAPGMPTDPVSVTDPRVPVAQWPSPGQELPVEVAADDTRNVRILWRQLPARDSDDYVYDDPAPYEASAEASAYEAGTYDGLDEPHEREYRPDPAPPMDSPRAPVIDFDLDRPPAGPVPENPAAAGAGPAVAPLPPELGDIGAPDEPAELPRPRRQPRPYPAQPRPEPPPPPVVPEPVPTPEPAMASAAAGAGTGRASTAATAAASGTLAEELVSAYPSAHPGPSGAITNVGITVLVTDLARSIEFYRDQLGFYEVDGGDGNTVLASGETRLVLRAVPGLAKTKQRSVYLNLEVSHLDAVFGELKAAGVRFTNPPRPVNRTARLELWAATFRDPDGHGIALTEWRLAPAAGNGSAAQQGPGVGDGDD